MFSGSMFLLKGILGIVCGLLLISVPDFTLGAFLTIFGLLLIAAGAISFIFAVTSQQTDTIFWFIVSGGIVLLGIFAFFIPHLFAAVFAISIAGWALVTGVWDLEKYICSQRRFYAIITGLVITSLVLIAGAFHLFPVLRGTYVTTIFGFFALVFGIFSFVLGEMIVHGRIPVCLSPAPPKTRT
ncbi:MAG: hypothetical protein A4E35_00696 [Methanoregula sp. PtaU1.Bin051]|nr:MAG: hypothetical protein A4E35_00696 [Methanoregula sp. PtaU1.Bin051]